MKPSTLVAFLVIACIGCGAVYLIGRNAEKTTPSSIDDPPELIVLRGACQFDEDHAFGRTLLKFQELVQHHYSGNVEFQLYLSSELGLEKDYFAYMSQGTSVDFAIVTPAHMSTFSKVAPLMDMPFLFRDQHHWEKVLAGDTLNPIAADVLATADVKLIGYAGGGTRNLIVNRPITNMSELKDLSMRVMGAPIQTKIFQAIGAAPSVIAYSEVYNAIQTGVIDGAENEAAGLAQMKFYEVGPEISLTRHAMTIRPICFSNKTFERLPSELQSAIEIAGREAGAYGRQLESDEDAGILKKLADEGKLRLHEFNDRQQLLQLAEPVKQAYAEEIGALEVYTAVCSVE